MSKPKPYKYYKRGFLNKNEGTAFFEAEVDTGYASNRESFDAVFKLATVIGRLA